MKIKFSDDIDVQLFGEIILLTSFISVLNIVSNILFGYSFGLNFKWIVMIIISILSIRDILKKVRITLWKNTVFSIAIFFLLPLAIFEIGEMNLIFISYAFLLTVMIGFLTNGALRYIFLFSHITINGTLFMLHSFYPEYFPFLIRQAINYENAFLDTFVQVFIALVISGYLTTRFSVVWRKSHNVIKHQNKQLLWLANHDELTSVFNRRYLLNYVAEQNQQKQCKLLIVDIDDFKRVNDKFGHIKGDEALITLAKSLDQTISDNGFVARFGGDEFVVFIYENSHESQEQTYKALVNALNDIFVEGIGVLTVSGGFVSFNLSDDFTEKLKDADKLLYLAKKEGKNHIVIE